MGSGRGHVWDRPLLMAEGGCSAGTLSPLWAQQCAMAGCGCGKHVQLRSTIREGRAGRSSHGHTELLLWLWTPGAWGQDSLRSGYEWKPHGTAWAILPAGPLQSEQSPRAPGSAFWADCPCCWRPCGAFGSVCLACQPLALPRCSPLGEELLRARHFLSRRALALCNHLKSQLLFNKLTVSSSFHPSPSFPRADGVGLQLSSFLSLLYLL